MRHINFVTVILVLFISYAANAQDDKIKIGLYDRQNMQGGYYNFSEPDKVNIEVNIWGYVKNPGKYLIPKGTTVIDVLSFAGGPLTEADLEKVRLYRPKNDSAGIMKDKITYLDYNDLLWEEKVKEKEFRINPNLEAGDVLLVPGSPRYFFRENLTFILSVTSFLLTAAILIVSVTKN